MLCKIGGEIFGVAHREHIQRELTDKTQSAFTAEGCWRGEKSPLPSRSTHMTSHYLATWKKSREEEEEDKVKWEKR